MRSVTKEFLVGCLVILVVGLLVVFGWLMGAIGPFVHEVHYAVMYSFAGGVEVGAPVRVSGVKVGKVDRIEFAPESGSPSGSSDDRATVRVTISVAKKAAPAVRTDSRFYVNMAGIIGERYVEISPGSNISPALADGSIVRGVDPPRIDQLLSQGYGVFGKIQEYLEENEASVTEFLSQMTHLLTDANQLLKGSERKKFFTLIDNLNSITGDMRGITKDLQAERAKKFFSDLADIVHRGSEVDKAALKKFLQDEGVRAHIF